MSVPCQTCAKGTSCGCGCSGCIATLERARGTSAVPPSPGGPQVIVVAGPHATQGHEPTPEQKKLGLTNTRFLPRGYDADVD